MDMLEPRDEADLIEIVQAALANETPLEVIGNGTKRGLGRPVIAEKTVSTRALSGVTMYEPAELCMTARAGTPMREIVNLLDQNGQELAFEPMGYHRIYGGDPLNGSEGGGTIGGLIGVNASGPRRIRAGAARDHLLGFRAVSGRGEVYKSGGRVMKNVTGYDLSKLITGAYGTLGIMSEVTFKVMPKAAFERTVLVVGLDDAAGLALLREATGLPYDISGFAHFPAGSFPNEATWNNASGLDADTSVTAFRLEGPEISVTDRHTSLTAHFKTCGGKFSELGAMTSTAFWEDIRDAAAVAKIDGPVWRISTAPSNGAALVEAIGAAGIELRCHVYDWAGGLIWLAVDEADDAHASVIRAALAPFGGHATLIRATDEVRSSVPVFHPQPKALAALSARVANSFDPHNILNRGRLVPYAGSEPVDYGNSVGTKGMPAQ